MQNLWMAGAVAISLAMSGPAHAMTSNDPVNLADVQQMIDKGDFSGAVEKLQMYVESTPHDADGFNLLGYSYRQQGQYDRAKQAYDRALRLDPGHRGVREYLGELYLKTNQPAKAEAELAILKDLCGTECEEYQTLAKAIAAAKK